jgi:hypothetical protein
MMARLPKGAARYTPSLTFWTPAVCWMLSPIVSRATDRATG